jgi:tungstate transport system substrate-binding protein
VARDAVRARWIAAALLVAAAGIAAARPPADAAFIVVASTTSTEQSGLFAHLLPAFKKTTNIDVRVVALGTGQALDTARRGDADVVFVHDQVAEEKFVAEGWGVRRWPVMVNDFVVVGPQSDPAGAKGHDVARALARIASTGHPFVSRGDRSGTHAAELRYWKAAGTDVAGTGKPAGYTACGCGMGQALTMAAATQGYVLSDRGTWLAFKNRGDLAVLVEGDKRLFNQYGVILVNPRKHPHVKKDAGQAFIDWLVSDAGQETIAAYKIDGGRLFFPNAKLP